MARYKRDYAGERRIVKKTLQLTPSEDQELETVATQQGATFSDFARELLLRRAAAVVAATRRNPEAHELRQELRAIGNNLNQIARHANISDGLRPEDHELLVFTLKQHERATARLLDL
jgi:hypothetical protein